MNNKPKDSLKQQIYTRMQEKETDELLEILRRNDKKEWTDIAFDVIKEILLDRGVKISSQERHHSVSTKSPVLTKEESLIPETKKCPYCAEIIKYEAIVCRYCGRDLITQTIYAQKQQTRSPENYTQQSVASQKYKQRMLRGLLLAVTGTIITVLSYSAASTSGGTYLLCTGAIIFGLIDFVVGLFGWLRISCFEWMSPHVISPSR